MTPLMIGTFTRQRPFFREVGRGLGLAGFDSASGRIELLDVLEGLVSPSYIHPLRDGALVPLRDGALVTCEEGEDAAAIAFVSAAGGRLALGGLSPIEGDRPCHIDVFGDRAACACYGCGRVTLHPLDPRGAPGPACSVARHVGRSAHPLRQTEAHAHAVGFSPDGAWLLSADLGTDQVFLHPVRDGGIEGAPAYWRAPPGSGPRVVSFAPDGRHVLVVMELSNEVFSLRWDGGRLREVSRAKTLYRANAANTAAGLRWHPSGALCAVSNRGTDSIAWFGFDAASGEISSLGEIASGGEKPRDFDFSPCGKWLVAGNQDSGELAVFAVDGDRIADTGGRFAFKCPSCVRFL